MPPGRGGDSAGTGREFALPPLYYLHVWWARRPLTPSRAAVLGSLLPADTDVDWFLRELGIEQVQADVNGVRWVLTGTLVERVVTLPSGEAVLPVDRWFCGLSKRSKNDVRRTVQP